MTMKLIQNLDYTEIYEGQPQNLVPISSFNTYMNVKVNGGGSNIVDFVLKLAAPVDERALAHAEFLGDARIAPALRTKENKPLLDFF